MKIKATPIKGKDLKAGDLFSTAGPGYWEHYQNRMSIGERVYIRTEASFDNDDAETQVYKIEIVKESRESDGGKSGQAVT